MNTKRALHKVSREMILDHREQITALKGRLQNPNWDGSKYHNEKREELKAEIEIRTKIIDMLLKEIQNL